MLPEGSIFVPIISILGQVSQRVHISSAVFASRLHHEVDVRPGGMPGRAHPADNLALGDILADEDRRLPDLVAVDSGQTVQVVDNHTVSEPIRPPPRPDNSTGVGGVNGSTGGYGEVESVMTLVKYWVITKPLTGHIRRPVPDFGVFPVSCFGAGGFGLGVGFMGG